MQPTIEVRIPKDASWPTRLALRNLAILLQADLHVREEGVSRASISLAANGREVQLPVPVVSAWRDRRIDTVVWRGIRLPQPSGLVGETPDLLGLVEYLFSNLDELRQEAEYPNQRYDIRRSPLGSVCATNYLDQAIRAAFEPLSLSGRRPCGVILTHDLDTLSPLDPRPVPWTFRTALRRTLSSFRRGRFRECLSHAMSLYPLVKTDRKHNAVRFEFLDWAEAEEEFGFRSVFFVFAPDRERTFRDDACYTFDDRNAARPKITLGEALRKLIDHGFLIGPHLSRSSGYLREEIDREFDSLSGELKIAVTATRNHWLWIRYSDWYQILVEKRIDFDFNQVAVGYTKGTSFPYLSTNHHTMVFPTIYPDDAVLSKARLFLSEERALELLSSQLDSLQESGGCSALSFHPARDTPARNFRIANKLRLYRRILGEIHKREIPVYLPAEGRQVFHRDVVFDGC